MKVSGETKVFALIGDPVEHTMSPAMHNAAFAELGLDCIYLPFHVNAHDLADAVSGLKALNVRGFNVTIPHKVSVVPMLDEVDPIAGKIGAVNTVVNDGGKLTGYNTDSSGFLRALLEQGIEPAGKDIVILGAGGASRAISYILSDNGARLTILNRRQELDWAVELAGRIHRDLGKEVRALELTEENLSEVLAGADILVNATSVGMTPYDNGSPVPAGLLKSGLTVFDIVYNPVRTRLLKEAAASGARTVSGVDMLAWQGALAFEKWTGCRAPVGLMRREVVKMLEKHED
jgi:shikimate dehydrogenase